MLVLLRILLLAVLASTAAACLPSLALLARRRAVAFALAPLAQVTLILVDNC